MSIQLLPTAQTKAQRDALSLLLNNNGVHLTEPCNCGGQIRHNNGGNYHSIVAFRLDAGKCWRMGSFTGDYAPPEEWDEVPFGKAVDEITDLAAMGYHLT